MAQIRMENVTVSYGDKKVLDNISIKVNDGECFSVLGPSACGKTTLARAICGFNKIESGEIYIGNTLFSSKPKNVNVAVEKRGIGVVFQDYAVWPHMTVFENVMYPLKKRRVKKADAIKRANKAIEQVRMKEYMNRLPSQLSGGQQQRVAIARALVSSTDIIILDEPITNLDANLREEMRFEIMELQKKNNITFVYITQDQSDAMAISDNMMIMDKEGKIRQTGQPEEIFKNPADSFVFKFLGTSNFLPVYRDGNAFYVKTDSGYSLLEHTIPKELAEKDTIYMASRPMEVDLAADGDIKGKIKNTTFLGNMYDYRVMLADHELRVQKDAFEVQKQGIFKPGDACAVKFNNYHYYGEA